MEERSFVGSEGEYRDGAAQGLKVGPVWAEL